jgi:hypothetical protein
MLASPGKRFEAVMIEHRTVGAPIGVIFRTTADARG